MVVYKVLLQLQMVEILPLLKVVQLLFYPLEVQEEAKVVVEVLMVVLEVEAQQQHLELQLLYQI